MWHKEFIDTEFGEFPKNWEVKRLSEIAELQRGLGYSGKEKSKDEIPDGYLFLTLNSIKKGGGLKEDGWTWIKSDRLKERHFVREGDIVIVNTDLSNDGSLIGSPAIVHFPEWYKKEKAVFSLDIFKLLLKVSNVDVNFLFYYLIFVQPLARKYHTGTTVWRINVDSWARDLLIPLPPLEEQKKIVKMLSIIDNKIEVETRYLEYLKRLKEKLLTALMSGRIRVNSITISDLL
ncbi:type I restriction endonuclease subunit S [Sulfolobus islandicus]|nr:type I restriction endonuclease subunit S [Sulfolobus islandicus]